MGSKIYVGGLPHLATESQLNDLFVAYGTMKSVRIIKDKFTGQSRRFGFVEMSTAEEARAAMVGLNGIRLAGRALRVHEARPSGTRRRGGQPAGAGGRSERRQVVCSGGVHAETSESDTCQAYA